MHRPAELAPAIDTAAEFDRKIIVEEAVPDAREIECAVLGNETAEASVPGEIVPSREFYDYEAKYIDSRSRLEIPGGARRGCSRRKCSGSRSSRSTRSTAAGSRASTSCSVGRTGELFINEINTLPGFTTISMYAKLWAASGVDYATLVDRLITLAVERHAAKQELKTSTF